MGQAAREQSRITHLDPRCAAGSIVVARAVALASFPTIDPVAFLDDLSHCAASEDTMMALSIAELTEWLGLDPVPAAEHVHQAGLDPSSREQWQGISAFVVTSVLWSLYAFLRSPDDYWETICTAIAVGGDTDTMAAIAGAISGARHGPAGFPPHLVVRLNDRGDWNALALTDLAHRAASLIKRPSGDSPSGHPTPIIPASHSHPPGS
jgi:ADP-ribosylglycohydrolase